MKKQSGLILCIAVLSSFLSGCLVPGSANVPPSPQPTLTQPSFESFTQVNLLTSDGVSLQAYYYPPLSLELETATLLLLHAAYQDHRSWSDFIESAQAEGYAVFTLDLRGPSQNDDEKTYDESMDNDIEAALDWMKNSSSTNVQQVVLIGESLGADLALRAGARHPEIPAVVLLSPGMQLWKIKIDEAIVNYGSRPLLLVSSEEDSYPAATVRQLDEQAQGPHELLLLPGSEHGTKMFNANPNLVNQIFSWLHGTEQ